MSDSPMPASSYDHLLMSGISHDPVAAPSADGGYSQGVEVATPGRLLHISGQIPLDRNGDVPAGFDEQCRQAWRNVKAVLTSAGMTTADLVKVTTFLASREHRERNSDIRQEELAGATPALTVVIVDIYDDKWLLEIEATAFRPCP